MRLFSYRHRPPHLGPFPAEALPRQAAPPALEAVASPPGLPYSSPDPESIVHAMARYAAMLDLVRDGPVQPLAAEIPNDPAERARHLKAAALYFDATMAACCALPPAAQREVPLATRRVAALGVELAASQPRSFAAGLDMILADVPTRRARVHGPVHHHSHALVMLVEHPRDPRPDEPGVRLDPGAQAERSALLAAQTAVLLASYLRLLGFEARAHTASCSEVVLQPPGGGRRARPRRHPPLRRPPLRPGGGDHDLRAAADRPLAPGAKADGCTARPGGWASGHGDASTATLRAARLPRRCLALRDPAAPRAADHLIDHARVPRFPKRADFFARALFGDLGKAVQDDAKNAHYVMKSPIGACASVARWARCCCCSSARRAARCRVDRPTRSAMRERQGQLLLAGRRRRRPVRGAALGLVLARRRRPDPMPAYHAKGINLLLDQGHETMEGASGDDWISVAQSMRAYLRFSLLGGVLAEQIRRLGWSARVHSVLDGDVLQPPLLLLSGLGEVSRIGEVILNPFLGPRLKSGTVTTDLPMAHDRPVDFGLQRFCEGCNKCARECPSGAISAGPKVVYNGYEIWKSDAEKCARYRITNAAGGMCGRCMKTCPWNPKACSPTRPGATSRCALPAAAPLLARLDDWRGRGRINPVKTWWWDIELDRGSGRYVRARATHRRGCSPA
jgi:ferredoxin